jgi:hypothetical protein
MTISRVAGLLLIEMLLISLGPMVHAFSDTWTRQPATPGILRVGPGERFALPSAAAEVARDGDTVLIDAEGVYDDDTAIWRAHNTIIRGVNGRPHIHASRSIDNGKGIWVLQGDRSLVENIEFSGAKVPYHNGAGLRVEGTGLTVDRCYFHHNENGILTGANSRSDIRIENSVFAFNGYGRGYSHNLYVGAVRSLEFIGNLSHHAVVGHVLKSRALRNRILYNRLMDGVDGRSSYLIDLPNGGRSMVLGNLIQQGPKAENQALLAYGMEGLREGQNALYVAYNTLVDDRHTGAFIKAAPGSTGLAVNNIFVGPGTLLEGEGIAMSNNLRADERGGFIDPDRFDYRLQESSPAVDAAVPVTLPSGVELLPEYELGAKGLIIRQIKGEAMDLGAFELGVM